jgi:hypothetical protein
VPIRPAARGFGDSGGEASRAKRWAQPAGNRLGLGIPTQGGCSLPSPAPWRPASLQRPAHFSRLLGTRRYRRLCAPPPDAIFTGVPGWLLWPWRWLWELPRGPAWRRPSRLQPPLQPRLRPVTTAIPLWAGSRALGFLQVSWLLAGYSRLSFSRANRSRRTARPGWRDCAAKRTRLSPSVSGSFRRSLRHPRAWGSWAGSGSWRI